MDITAKMVSDLRARTGAGMMECKKALVEAQGNEETAIEILRKKGVATAAKKAGRNAEQGVVEAYIHSNHKVGVLIEVACESDFVAKNEDFRSFVRDLCMHIAAFSPAYIVPADVPAEAIAKEKEIAAAQLAGKPANMIEKILTGKINKWYSEVCLMQQPWIHDDKTCLAKLAPGVKVNKFVRWTVGQEL